MEVQSAVIAIVNYNGKVLLGKKRKDSKRILKKMINSKFSIDKVTVGGDLEDLMWVEKQVVLACCSKRAVDLWSEEVKNYFNCS
jgi:hypothetical protein